MSDIGIDTQSLLIFLRDDLFFEKLSSYLKKNERRLIIPNMVVQEIVSFEDETQVTRDIKRLSAIWGELNLKLSFSRPWDHVVKKEIEKQLQHTPTISSKERDFLKFIFAEDVGANQTNLHKAKTVMKGIDSEALERAEKIGGPINPNEIYQALKNFNGTSVENPWFARFSELDTRFNGKKVVENPSRYKAASTLANLFTFYGLGLLIDPTFKAKNPDPIWALVKKKWGTHHDFIIGAECAYCEILITNDFAFCEISKILLQKKLLYYRAVHTDEISSSMN